MAISKVFSQDVRFRFHLSCVYVVLSLAFFSCRSQAIQLPEGCAKVASASAKIQPSVESLIQVPHLLTNAVDCLLGAIKLIQKNGWQTVEATVQHGVNDLIQNIRVLLSRNPKAFATEGGLVFLSSYLLYKSTELSEQAKGLELEYRSYQEEFKLLQLEQAPIMSLIDGILRNWKNGNDNKLAKKIDQMSEKLSRSSTILKELVSLIDRNILKCESGKAWSVSYSIFAAGVYGGSIVTGNPTVYVPGCGFFVGVFAINSENFISFEKTLKKSESLRENIKEWRIEVTKYHTSLEIVKMKL